MEGFKEFQGKDLDSAIEDACNYYNTVREKLEIEIVQDAKSGIFGIVGVRKAKVRARRVQLREAVESILGKKGGTAPADGQAAPADGQAVPANGQAVPVNGQDSSARDEGATAGQATASGAEARDNQDAGQRDARQPRAAHDDRHKRGRGRKAQAEEGAAAEKARAPRPAPQRDQPGAGDAAGEKPVEKADERQARAGDKDGDKAAARGGAKGSGKNAANDSGNEKQPAAGGQKRDGRGRKSENRPDARNGARHPAREGARDTARFERAPRLEGPLDGLDEDFEEVGEGLPVTPLEQLDAVRLESFVEETVRNLVRPIVGGDVSLAVRLGGGKVHVSVDCDEDSGLLIGREGQTLASLQYMVSRIVSRGMGAAVRVQLDAGEYRLRQDEKLREMALALAEKVRQSGRSYSTRPLSSYHRRIVHVCLQDAPDVQTRSSGDGPLKRVVILRKKGEKA